ncbi:MAG TPA: hypothetical protein VFQ61_07305 [Polyangiaceae bacterium]|nr:hypothetical protein [Polyangiaceae bacterium]
MIRSFDRNELRIALGALLAAALIYAWPSFAVRRSTKMEIAITVVPPDARGLQCRSPRPVVGARCGVGEGNLRPYVTLGGKLVLLAGVFEDPAVAAWYEQAKSHPRERVRVICAGERLGAVDDVEVRFGPDQPFKKSGQISAARVKTCRIERDR